MKGGLCQKIVVLFGTASPSSCLLNTTLTGLLPIPGTVRAVRCQTRQREARIVVDIARLCTKPGGHEESPGAAWMLQWWSAFPLRSEGYGRPSWLSLPSLLWGWPFQEPKPTVLESEGWSSAKEIVRLRLLWRMEVKSRNWVWKLCLPCLNGS